MGVSTGIGKGHLSSINYTTREVGEFASFCFLEENFNGWLLCDGRDLEIDKYPELYSRLQSTYGSENGLFTLPDARGRVIGCAGDGSLTSISNRELGEFVGSETHTQTLEELAIHNHYGDDYIQIHRGSADDPDWFSGTVDVLKYTDNKINYTYDAGGGKPFNIMQPTAFIGYLYIFSGV